MDQRDDLEANMLGWAQDALDDEARRREQMTDAELEERPLTAAAEFYLEQNGSEEGGGACTWVSRRDPDFAAKMRSVLIEDEGLEPAWADQVVAKMVEIGRPSR